ncbi:IS3 family transposase, partial [Advenella sp. RU8]|uniref:IS3 family transposase n=1 Tax=Advenella sp. RU8 TaxID=3399575 RepID=UPI003AAB8248
MQNKYAVIKDKICDLYEKHEGRYGYRRIKVELCNALKVVINHKVVQRLMQELGLTSLVRIKRYQSYKGTTGEMAPNVLQRQFDADKPNQKWVTDVTEFKIKNS